MPSLKWIARLSVWLAATVWAPPTLAKPTTCGAPFVSISQIQGNDESSFYEGQALEVEATLSADFRGGEGAFGQLHAVFVQQLPGDEDPNTSDGVIVTITPELQSTFGLRAFAPGTRLRIAGRVQEAEGETQLLADSIITCGVNDTPTPTEISLPVSAESLEGMLVRITSPLRLSAFNDFGEYGELSFVAFELARAFTDRSPPDRVNFGVYDAAVLARTLMLDDGFDERYHEPHWEPPNVRLGAMVVSPLTGVVRPSTAPANFRLEPTVLPQLSEPVAPPSAPVRDPQSTRIVSTNLHNLFKDGGDNAACYPTHDASSCRGATSANDRSAHRSLAASKLAELDADVIVAAEVQNDFGGVETPTWQLLVDELNSHDTGRCEHYEAALPNAYLGSDAIAVAIAYCAERMDMLDLSWPDDDWLVSLPTDEQGYIGLGASRLPLLATFRDRETTFALTVVANHWKSRSPGSLETTCSTVDPDCDQRTGEGYWSASRARAARGLLKWLTVADQISETIVLAGDFNAYAMEAPLQLLTSNGYLSLVEHAKPNDDFTYTYASRVGYLDHLLVSRRAAHRVVSFAALPGNSETFGVDPGAYSDHNPLVMDLQDTLGTCECDAPHAQLGTLGDDILVGTPGDDIVCGLAGDDVFLGLGGNDCFDAGTGDDWNVNFGSVTSNGKTSDPTSSRWCADTVD